jgi:hypothetical protein
MKLLKNLLLLAIFSLSMQMKLAAQEIPESNVSANATVDTVKVNSRKNPGNLPYLAFLKNQETLKSYFPPEPRLINYSNRMTFTELTESEQDSYEPKNWDVAVVGDTVDQLVPVSRGGYFVLPDIPEARKERAQIAFNSQTRKGWIGVAVHIKSEGNSLPYSSFSQIFSEWKKVHDSISWYQFGFRNVKSWAPDSLKVCFAGASGGVLLDEIVATTQKRGRCQFLKFDAEMAKRNPLIRFQGEIENLTFEEFPAKSMSERGG